MSRRRPKEREVPNSLDTSLLAALAAFEFSDAESRALLALLSRREPVPLRVAAADAGLPRSTAHSALRALAKRGLIFCEGRYPAEFRAAPVSRLATLAAARIAAGRRAAEAAELLASALQG
jgi:sugar-specific transcriptional regulator TrmB